MSEEEKYEQLRQVCVSYRNEVADLESKLAEKEGKIETLKQRIDSIVKIYSDDFVSKDTELKELRYKVKQHNQDKISFAVEQLEKVKERYPRGTTMWSSDKTEDGFEYVSDYIDNQIKELKKEIKQYDK